MQSRHKLDTDTWYLGNPPDPNQSKQIEDPEIDPVPKNNPSTKFVYPEPYQPDPPLKEAVNLAIALGRPLLLQGEPGCGKTRLAYAIAFELGLPLEECYIKSTSRAQDLLYTYEAINRLYDAQLGKDGPQKFRRPLSHNAANYIRLGPLGRAIARAQYGRRSVVLIDEIDKADLDFPNDLLWELDRLKFKVAETPEIEYAVPEDEPKLRPIIIVTHNEEKALPTAFLRRCIFHYLKFPEDPDQLKKILELHQIANEELSPKAIEAIQWLRQIDGLDKKPGLSELLDWVAYIKEFPPLESLNKIPYAGVLLKQEADQKRVLKELVEDA